MLKLMGKKIFTILQPQKFVNLNLCQLILCGLVADCMVEYIRVAFQIHLLSMLMSCLKVNSRG